MHAGRDGVVLTYPKHANVKKCNCINARKIWDGQRDRQTPDCYFMLTTMYDSSAKLNIPHLQDIKSGTYLLYLLRTKFLSVL